MAIVFSHDLNSVCIGELQCLDWGRRCGRRGRRGHGAWRRVRRRAAIGVATARVRARLLADLVIDPLLFRAKLVQSQLYRSLRAPVAALAAFPTKKIWCLVSAWHAIRRRSGRRRGGGAAAIIVDHSACLLAVCNIKPLRIHPETASRAISINTPQFRIIGTRGDARSLHETAWPVRCGPSLLPHAVLACLGREITEPAT